MTELSRVLAYPKFRLPPEKCQKLLGEYFHYCEFIGEPEGCPVECRDPSDQPFLDLAHSGRAQVLVSSDRDLLTLAGRTRFLIETPEAYRLRVLDAR
jgi:putative PIN family toxin of toxin-antitoxin system